MQRKGFIVLPRSLLESPRWTLLVPNHQVVFITIVARANWEDKEWCNGPGQPLVRRGQLITSQQHLADHCAKGMDRNVVRRALKRLKSVQLIDQVPGQDYTLITVLNYDAYTTKPYLGTREATSKPTNDRPATDQRPTTTKGIKRSKELKNTNTTTCVSEFQDYWNSHPRLRRIKKMSDTRVRRLRTRLQESDFREGWRESVTALANLPFYTGNNDRGWRANVDWFLRDDTNWMKPLEKPGSRPLDEGDYHSGIQKQDTQAAISETQAAERSEPTPEFKEMLEKLANEKDMNKAQRRGRNR